jgi:putative ABC transport system substrate-binding protein
MPAFRDRLRELGWIDGRNVALEYRWAEGRSERFAALADEFVRLKVDVIVTSGTAVFAAMQATSYYSNRLYCWSGPGGSGFVASLARPGGNVTGLSIQSPDLVGKRLEFLREVVPELRQVAVIGNGRYPAAVLEIGEGEPPVDPWARANCIEDRAGGGH